MYNDELVLTHVPCKAFLGAYPMVSDKKNSVKINQGLLQQTNTLEIR